MQIFPFAPAFSLTSLAANPGDTAENASTQPKNRTTVVESDFERPTALLRLHDMTLFAVPLHERRMHVLFEEVPILRCVWSMTARAVHHGGFYVDVGLGEGFVLGFVALAA